LRVNMEKLSHLESHQYDPNCKFCMNNVFVKDAIATKEKVQSQNEELQLLQSQQQSLMKQLDMYSDVEDYWNNYTKYNSEYHKGVIVLDRDTAELSSLKHKLEVYQTQLIAVEESIQKRLKSWKKRTNSTLTIWIR
jgi:galactose-1-phosphate uridylyltransferase